MCRDYTNPEKGLFHSDISNLLKRGTHPSTQFPEFSVQAALRCKRQLPWVSFIPFLILTKFQLLSSRRRYRQRVNLLGFSVPKRNLISTRKCQSYGRPFSNTVIPPLCHRYLSRQNGSFSGGAVQSLLVNPNGSSPLSVYAIRIARRMMIESA